MENNNELLESLIGKASEEGLSICKSNGYKYVVVIEDCVRYIFTQEYNPRRIRAEIVNGIIVNYEIG